MRRGKILALLLGATGAGGMFAPAPAEASLQVGNTSSPHEEEMAFQTAHQSRTIEALEDFLWRYGHRNAALRLRAIYELSAFECIGGNPGVKGACAPGDARGGDNTNRKGYGG